MAKQLFSYVKSLLMSALVLSSVAFVGCEELGQGDGPGGLPTLAIVTEEGEEVSELTINAPIEGTTYTFGVKTNATSWNATCEADWVELTKSNGVVTVTVAANEGDVRSTEISLTTSSLKRVITVLQDGEMDIDAIYYEAFGAVEATKTYGSTGTYWPYVDQFFDDGKMTVAGEGASAVTYYGNSVSVRPTMASSDYEGASGVNSCLFSNGKADAYLIVEGIALGGATQLQLSFGVSHGAGQNVYTTMKESDIEVLISANGSDYVAVPVTLPTVDAWGVATSEFAVSSEVSTLYIKFNVPMNAEDQSAIRVDDIKLVEGGAGALVDLDTSSSVEVTLPTTALDTFQDTFQTVTNYEVYKSENWWFTSNDRKYPATPNLGWHGRTYGTDAYISIAPYQSTQTEVLAFAGTLLNVKAAANKTLAFQLAIYYQTEDQSKLELVASTDFAGDVTTATWEVVQDLTFPAASTMNEWKDYSVDLSKYADSDKVYVAWRYTGKSNTYRLDNVAFNAEISDEPIVDQTSVSIPFVLDGTKGKEQIDTMDGVTQFGLGENYKNGNIKFGSDQACICIHANAAIGTAMVEAYATGDATTNAFEFLGSVDGVEYTRIDSVTMSEGKNVVQEVSTTSEIPSDVRFIKIVYHKVSGSGTNASVSKVVLAAPGGSVDVPEIKVSPEKIEAPAEGATATLTYELKNFAGTAVPEFACEADWVTIGEVSEGAVEVTVAENTGAEGREATITVTVAGIEGSVEVAVSQVGTEYVEPETLSVAEVVALYDAGNIEAINAAKMTGYVALVAEDASQGISARSLLVVDNTGAKNSGIMLYNITGTGLAAGDKVTVDLSTAEIATYNGLRELKGFTVSQFTKVEGESATIAPVEISAADLADYQSMLVSIKDVQAVESAVGYVFCTADKGYTTKFTDGTTEIAVYCTKQMTALNDVEVGAQTATITGWVGCYNTPQLIPTVESAMQFAATAQPSLAVTPTSVEVVAAGATTTLTYELKNFVGTAVPEFTCEADWITIGEVSEGAVEVTVAENASEESREATITVTVAGIEGSVEVAVSQVGTEYVEPEALSVAEVVALYDAGDIEAINAAKVTGYVALVAEDASQGISAKSILVVDNTGEKNSGLMLYNITGTGLAAGDKVTVDLSTAEIATYNGLRELKGFTVSQFTKVEGESATIAPVEISAAELGDYQSMLVSIKDVRATDAVVGTTFCTSSKNTSSKFTDGTNEFVVYCSKAMTELNDMMIGSQTATITGWVGCYNTPQLIPTVESAKLFENKEGVILLTPAAIEMTAEGGSQNVTFELQNITSTDLPTFTSDAAWVTFGEVSAEGVTVTVAANEVTEARSATVTATLGETTATLTVTQEALVLAKLLYSTGFESEEGFAAGQVYNNEEAALSGADGQQWSTIFGTPSTTKPIAGTQSMQMRCYKDKTTAGSSTMNFDLEGVSYVEFDAQNTNGVNVLVQYSTDGGTTWTGDQTYTLNTQTATYTYNVSEEGVTARVKFTLVIPASLSSTSRLYIDNVKVYGAAPTVEEGGDIDFGGSVGSIVE